MLLKFKDGTTKTCANPLEHRLLRNGISIGWICTIRILEDMPTSEIDKVLTLDNISELTFCDESLKELFVISGYKKIGNVIIRHPGVSSEIEIQLEK